MVQPLAGRWAGVARAVLSKALWCGKQQFQFSVQRNSAADTKFSFSLCSPIHCLHAHVYSAGKPHQLLFACPCGKRFRNALGLGGHKATCKASFQPFHDRVRLQKMCLLCCVRRVLDATPKSLPPAFCNPHFFQRTNCKQNHTCATSHATSTT